MLRPLIIVGDMIKFPESPRSHKFWQLDMSELVNVKRERERERVCERARVHMYAHYVLVYLVKICVSLNAVSNR